MEKLNSILSIIASIVAIISAACSFNFYKKTLKIHQSIKSSYSNNNQSAGHKSKQVIGKGNRL